ncbi:MAG: GNAT family N-acetyltransferase [Clostridia bacterium]|nr:GNAT family N-acetyltransferase [Clostridia bacterium]MBQ3076555.1 GNAT family N-acetyltransferase [Clostridia bacterium]
MRYQRAFVLKDGSRCIVRHAAPERAAEVLEHMRLVSGETDFMARYPDEILTPDSQQRAHLANVEADFGEVYLCADLPGVGLAGVAWLEPVAPLERFCHRAELAIAVRQAHTGRGIGRVLMEALEECARAAGYLQMELEVAAPNLPAQSLYHKMGYTVCGRIPRALRYRDGRFSEIYYMVKPL